MPVGGAGHMGAGGSCRAQAAAVLRFHVNWHSSGGSAGAPGGQQCQGHSLPLPALPAPGPAMPFGCVTLGDKKDYNQPSEVTDRYDLGQVIKT